MSPTWEASTPRTRPCGWNPDLRDRGNPEVAQATANQYLLTIREQLEDATRLALIYPCAFMKLAPVESVDPLKRVSCAALPPWEVIVDATACSWDQQRHVGHVYLMPVAEASGRYGKESTEFRTRAYSKWIEATGIAGKDTMLGIDSNAGAVPDSDRWVRIVELYDLKEDRLLVWSPDFGDGNAYLFEGVRVQVGALDPGAEAEARDPEGEIVHETTGIPYKSASGRPVVPCFPAVLLARPGHPAPGLQSHSSESGPVPRDERHADLPGPGRPADGPSMDGPNDASPRTRPPRLPRAWTGSSWRWTWRPGRTWPATFCPFPRPPSPRTLRPMRPRWTWTSGRGPPGAVHP